jgi:hypothetical protein
MLRKKRFSMTQQQASCFRDPIVRRGSWLNKGEWKAEEQRFNMRVDWEGQSA